MEPDPSSLVPIPTLPPHLQMLVPNSLGPVGQDARSTKLPESLGPLCSPYIESPPCRLRSGDQTGHVAPGTPPPFTMQDSNFLAMVGASLESHNICLLHIRTKTCAQHAAAASSGNRGSSSLKCVAVSTLQYTTPHIPPQVQDAPPLLSSPLSLDPQDSVILASVHSAAEPQTENHIPVLPEEGLKAHSPVNNPYVDPPVRQLVVVNKAANTIHSPEDGTTKNCYGWDPILDGDSDNTISNQDLDMLDDPHGETSGDTRRMMDQHFACLTHTSVGKDFMGLEDTLNNVWQQLGETVVSDPAEEDQALYAHKDLVQHNPILRAQTIEVQCKARVAMALLRQQTPSQTSVGCRLEAAQGGPNMYHMEINGTDYHQPDKLISDHLLVTGFLHGQGRTMNYSNAFNTVKQTKAFCREHFNGLDLQAVYHNQEHHCATAAWGGRAKGAHVCIIKAFPKLYQAQSQMHAQQAQDVLLNQMEVVNASPAIAARQGADMQVGAPEEGADTTGVENGTWSSDVLLMLLDLPYDGTPSTTVTLNTIFGASWYWYQCTETDYEHAQPSNIKDVANPGEMSTGVVCPPSPTTGSVKHGQPVAPTGSRGGATIVDHDMTVPQERSRQADMEMTGATSGVGHNQALQGLDGSVHRVSAISLVGKGVDGEDQTAAGELAWGKEPPSASTEMEVNILDEKRSLEISSAWKGPIQSLMVTQRILGISPSKRPTWHSLTLTWMLSKVSRTLVHAAGGMGKHSCL